MWGARHGGAFDHMSVAVLAKDTTGSLQLGLHDSTAKDLALGGAVLRAALLVVAPTVEATVAAAAGGLPGAKGIAAHLRHVIPGDKLQEVSELLGFGECCLLLVAIDRRVAEISPLLEQAEKRPSSKPRQVTWTPPFTEPSGLQPHRGMPHSVQARPRRRSHEGWRLAR